MSAEAPELQARLAARLAGQDGQGLKGIDMTRAPELIDDKEVFRGPIFVINQQQVAMFRRDGSKETIDRQLIRHAPCVVMLVHDCAADAYLLTREYRVGAQAYVFGLPAGFIGSGESPVMAVLRELREETGLVPGPEGARGSESHLNPEDGWIDAAPDVYSSLGMSDELGHIMVLHLRRWHQGPTDFDPGEHIESTWVSWQELCGAGVTDAKAMVAIQHEAIRRLKEH
ncbi:NUDIX hydrolase [Bifidobacterium asteroides]|uniref:NTP pyrophosphohydrolase n=1 Tax=Bifidobacterium asteroides TaxID=1684 RepID=A0A318M7L6_9BIFI|nr:NUDIX hydrolase [Bifidobacterium asteroides]PXY82920.1 NTP pyrophosphohydrolase [Bifidobacterium asteroides]